MAFRDTFLTLKVWYQGQKVPAILVNLASELSFVGGND